MSKWIVKEKSVIGNRIVYWEYNSGASSEYDYVERIVINEPFFLGLRSHTVFKESLSRDYINMDHFREACMVAREQEEL